MTAQARRAIEERIERLEEVAERWDVPGGSRRLALRARDKAEGLRVARRMLAGSSPHPEAEATGDDVEAERRELEDWLHDGRWPEPYDLSHALIAAGYRLAARRAAPDTGLRERIEDATGAMRSAVEHGPGTYAPAGWHALCVRTLARLAAAPAAVDHDTGDVGLERRYHVEKITDPTGKHDACRYFVLDPQHDAHAATALRAYADVAGGSVADDIRVWLRSLGYCPRCSQMRGHRGEC